MLEILSDNRDLKESIMEAEKMLSDIDITRLPSYELGKEMGIEVGIETGIKTGIKKGIKTGIETGIKKGDKKRQLAIAKGMLGKLPDQDILEYTKLSLKELEQLKGKN